MVPPRSARSSSPDPTKWAQDLPLFGRPRLGIGPCSGGERCSGSAATRASRLGAPDRCPSEWGLGRLVFGGLCLARSVLVRVGFGPAGFRASGAWTGWCSGGPCLGRQLLGRAGLDNRCPVDRGLSRAASMVAGTRGARCRPGSQDATSSYSEPAWRGRCAATPCDAIALGLHHREGRCVAIGLAWAKPDWGSPGQNQGKGPFGVVTIKSPRSGYGATDYMLGPPARCAGVTRARRPVPRSVSASKGRAPLPRVGGRRCPADGCCCSNAKGRHSSENACSAVATGGGGRAGACGQKGRAVRWAYSV